MISRQQAMGKALKPLLNLLEQRFAVQLDCRAGARHLRDICEHYDAKREFLLCQHGETAALARDDYAKAVLISETARLMLREIDPWPRRKKLTKGKSK